jgi:hypothetical protein
MNGRVYQCGLFHLLCLGFVHVLNADKTSLAQCTCQRTIQAQNRGMAQRVFEGRNDAILNESDILITESHIAVSGQRFLWGDLGIVQMVKPSGWLMRLLTGGKPLYQLRIAVKGTSAAKTIFNTQDARLAQRIEHAISTVAQRRGASREI